MATLNIDRNFMREVVRDFPVDISRSRNGVEQRRLVDAQKIIGFEFTCPIMDVTEMRVVQAFWDARSGAFEAFTFVSPFDGLSYECRFKEGSWSCDEASDSDGIYHVSFAMVVLELT